MNTGSVRAGPRGRARFGPVAATAAALLIYMASAPAFAKDAGSGVWNAGVPGANVGDTRIWGTGVSGTRVSGTRVLEAADHAELAARVSASGVVRIALPGDRIARVVRAPGGLRVEHDPASGDLYLHPAGGAAAAGSAAAPEAVSGAAPEIRAEAAPQVAPEVLFIGTERGFTYRLSLMPAPAGASQILIRNPAVMASAFTPARTVERRDDRVRALVGLIRAVARREPPPGHAIHSGGAVVGTGVAGLTVIETWRGPRFTALLLEAGPSAPGGAEGAADLAGTLVPETLVPETLVPETIAALPGTGPVAALWLAAPGTGPSGGRLAVAVRESVAGAGR